LIRINLLPVRAFRRKENIRRQVSIFFLSVVFLIGVLGFLYTNHLNVVRELTTEKETLAAQERELRKKVQEVEQLKQEEAELQRKLQVVADLENRRSGPVRILDEISRRTPPNKAWLVNLGQAGDTLSLKGYALDNETIALFMSNLQASDYFSNIELVRSAEETRQEIRVKSFSLTAGIVLKKPETPDEGVLNAPVKK